MPPEISNKTLKKTLKKIKDITPKSRFMWGMMSFLLGRSAYHQLGWFKSAWKENSVDKNGEPIPWISYPAISFIEKKCTPDKKLKVWEYGSGNSTIWWSKRAKTITALEHHKGWYDHIRSEISKYKGANVTYHELNESYPRAILKDKTKYDVIVIDGRMRNECSKIAPGALSKNGVIIWDNTDREKYKEGIRNLEKSGFKRIDFVGLFAIGNYIGQTTIFYKKDNVLDI